MSIISRRTLLASIAALCATGPAAHATATFPSNHVTIIVGASAGSGVDAVTRIIADRLSQVWGRRVTVMNRPGSYGVPSLQAATSAPADGHTLVASAASSFVVGPEIQKGAAELQREIIPVGLLGVQPMAIAVNPTVGANTLAELVAITRQRPDEILYGTGRATFPHLTGARLAATGHLKWRFIPSPGPRAVQDAMSGTLHVAIESISALAAPINAGLLKGLAIAAPTRLPEFPDLPTVGEAVPALAGFEANGWVALMARAGTPEPIITKINQDLRAILADPDVARRLATVGTYPRPLTPAETAAFIQNEKDVWRPVVQSLDLTTQ